jgi:hypothetical protein
MWFDHGSHPQAIQLSQKCKSYRCITLLYHFIEILAARNYLVFRFRYITQSEAETIPLVVNKNKNCTKRMHFIEAEILYREETQNSL